MLVKLFINSDLEVRKNAIEKLIQNESLNLNHPDLLFFDDQDKLGVEQTKKIKEFLSLKPYSAKSRVVTILSAHNLTTQAQNSLLKLLEEPPLNSQIYLGANSESRLLSTILSRCEIIYIERDSNGAMLPRMTQKPHLEDIEKLFGMSIELRFQFVESISDKDLFLEELIIFFRERMKKDTSVAVFAKKLLQAEEWAKASVNIRGILEFLMFNFPDNKVTNQ